MVEEFGQLSDKEGVDVQVNEYTKICCFFLVRKRREKREKEREGT